MTDLTAKVKYINDHQKLIEDTKKQSGLSVGQQYLRIIRLKHIEGGCTESPNTLPECNLNGMTSMSYAIARDSITISINRSLKESNNDTENSQDKRDEIESSSSIVELELNVSETASSTLSLPVLDPTSSMLVINAPMLPLTCPTLPAESSHMSPVTFSSPNSVTQQSTHVPYSAAPSSDYYLLNSFFYREKKQEDSYK
ncbi:unnamed protein product [Mytilus coruscus]|nr:unnamed protein product [Mytilus coruscus]